ncbi:MAG: hypothetical protein NTV58_17625 [Deltaproteobacteria bacterium]|nr:hypothetical protein [Deltaproteobacteria bacterium]
MKNAILCCIVLLGCTFLLSTPIVHGGAITTKVTTKVTFQATSKILIDDEISNLGDDTAHNVTVTTFLGGDARHSDVLGDNRPGGTIRYTCAFDGTILKPGQYILITRINFNEKYGTSHITYHFTTFAVRAGEAKGKPALTVRVDTPVINLKSPLGSRIKINLSLKNGHGTAIEPVVFFALPDDLKMEAGEMDFRLNAGEEKALAIPVAVTGVLKGDVSYQMIVRYEENNNQYARQVEGKVRVEERPVLFKAFLVVGLVVLICVLVVFFYRRKKN